MALGPAQRPGQRREKSPVETAEEYFGVCDYNGDGSISFREARSSLLVERDNFPTFDKDGSGLIDKDEFIARYLRTIELGGAFPPPIPEVEMGPTMPATPADYLKSYDINDDEKISQVELDESLREYQRVELNAEIMIGILDVDNSGKLEQQEIVDLLRILVPKEAGTAEDGATPEPAPASIDELFGQAGPRSDDRENLPPRILGPTSHFRRLDLDGDGLITADDLNRLQRRMNLPMNAASVIAYLDTDGDGGLTRAEFTACMMP